MKKFELGTDFHPNAVAAGWAWGVAPRREAGAKLEPESTWERSTQPAHAAERQAWGGFRSSASAEPNMTYNTWSQDLYLRAYKFAANAHQGQTVPGTNLPYLMHLSFVSMEVIAALHQEPGHDENLAVQCALLHDVIEDTPVTYAQVREEFGPSVADGVLALSKEKTLAKELQMPDSLRRIRQQPSEVWLVKLADRITNLQRPPAYWTKDKLANYQAEAHEILKVLGPASAFLAARLREKIRAYSAYA